MRLYVLNVSGAAHVGVVCVVHAGNWCKVEAPAASTSQGGRRQHHALSRQALRGPGGRGQRYDKLHPITVIRLILDFIDSVF